MIKVLEDLIAQYEQGNLELPIIINGHHIKYVEDLYYMLDKELAKGEHKNG